jgi:hypothetical protein
MEVLMTTFADPTHSRHSRRARAVYGTLPTTRSGTTDSAGSLLAELAMLAVFLLVVAGVIALRAWLHVPQF